MTLDGVHTPFYYGERNARFQASARNLIMRRVEDFIETPNGKKVAHASSTAKRQSRTQNKLVSTFPQTSVDDSMLIHNVFLYFFLHLTRPSREVGMS